MSFLLNYLGLLSVLVQRLSKFAPPEVLLWINYWHHEHLCRRFLYMTLSVDCISSLNYVLVYNWSVTRMFSISWITLTIILLIYINFTAWFILDILHLARVCYYAVVNHADVEFALLMIIILNSSRIPRRASNLPLNTIAKLCVIVKIEQNIVFGFLLLSISL